VTQRRLDNEARVAALFEMPKRTGGRVAGQLSMTPNAIRKRAARAQKREASAA
jgi:hypothetical protein